MIPEKFQQLFEFLTLVIEHSEKLRLWNTNVKITKRDFFHFLQICQLKSVIWVDNLKN
jgi:hypothetical protein